MLGQEWREKLTTTDRDRRRRGSGGNWEEKEAVVGDRGQ